MTAARSDSQPRHVYVWRNTGETEEEALQRHYEARPKDRDALHTYVVSWIDAGRATGLPDRSPPEGG
jgi:hypothetical protein